jgi:hypothetical protein
MDENVKLSNRLYGIEQGLKNRIKEYEKLEEEINQREVNKFNTMALMNIQHELHFIKSLLFE